MRIRSIKPEFFKHDVLASLCPISRLLFIGLWCMADCAGRLEDRPKRIKAEVLPYDDCEIETLISELSEKGFIIRYQVEDKKLIEIPSFSRHQRIMGKEADTLSRFPAIQKKKVGKQRGNNGETTGNHTGLLEGKGRETEGKGDAFAKFWNAYPKKKAKESAVKAFEKTSAPIEILLTALERARSSPEWQKDKGQFIPYPATWLNGKRWEDEALVVLPAPEIRSTVEYGPEAYKTPMEMLAERKAREAEEVG